MGIKIANPADGTFIVRPVEFEEQIRRACRRVHGGIKCRVYESKNGTRIRVTTIR